MWRYERPQKGRTREFFQWNVDLLGVDSPEADAEMAAVIATFFKRTGLSSNQVAVLVNNRRLIDSELAALDIPKEQRPIVSRLIDRKDKMPQDDWIAYSREIGLALPQLEGIQALLANSQLWKKSDELLRFFKAVDALGVAEYVRYDPSIIRGLDYYTGTVFEAKEIEGDIRRSILGGGRYDNLTEDVGGDPIPGVGFAMGDVVVTLILEKAGLLPKGNAQARSTVLVTVFDKDSLLDSFALASELRREGILATVYPEPAKLPKQFKFADRTGMCVAVVLGPDEKASGRLTIKNLASGAQETVLRPDAVKVIRNLLDRDISM
jgi:histidyl-tRNA synthetase